MRATKLTTAPQGFEYYRVCDKEGVCRVVRRGVGSPAPHRGHASLNRHQDKTLSSGLELALKQSNVALASG